MDGPLMMVVMNRQIFSPMMVIIMIQVTHQLMLMITGVLTLQLSSETQGT